ncbi:MAG: AMIN domain-containing protein [Candidatus Aminicenantes bacterium]|nr:AMIN domain-containing protein [Candidatus Aminicenantes bacterium]
MTKLNKILGIILLTIIGVVNICLYRNVHLYNKAKTIGNYEEKIQTLDRANRNFPYNYMVYSELGRTYSEMASLDFMNVDQRDANFEKSVQSFIRSIKLNPGYYQSHFYFAQALSYQQYFSPIKIDFYEEYKKAARLTTFDTKAYFEVGRFLFSHWLDLSEEDKRYTLSLLKNLTTNRENLKTIMQIWAINGGDFSVMEDILPKESGVYRIFAQFLAERRLSISKRHEKLAQAEYIDFMSAKNSFSSGERQAQLQNVNQAVSLFRESLQTIENIHFYQNMTGDTFLDLTEFHNLKKALYLNLAKNLIIKSGDLKEAETYLRNYLDMENTASEIGDLEFFLQERNLLKVEPGTSYNDLFSYYVKVLIDYKLNRNRGIIEGGENLKKNFSTPPEAFRKDLARICQLIGESYKKSDFLYDAEEFFNLALNLDPTYLDTLKGMHQNFIKLNETEKAEAVENQIKSLLTPEEINFENLEIQRDRKFKQMLFLKEKKIGLILTLQGVRSNQSPLIAIEFNGQLIWEDYLGTQDLSLIVNSEEGTNVLEILPIIQNVSLQKIVYTENNEIIQDIERERKPLNEPIQSKSNKTSPLKEQLLESEQIEQSSAHAKIKLEQPTQKITQNPSLSFINGIEYVVSQDTVEIEVLTDHFLNFNIFEMSNPDRIILDISGIADIKSERRFEIEEKSVQEIRLGMFKSDTARVVFYVDQNSLRYSAEKTPQGIKITFITN